jgi:hypothetical protein
MSVARWLAAVALVGAGGAESEAAARAPSVALELRFPRSGTAWAGVRNAGAVPLLVCMESADAEIGGEKGYTDAQVLLEWFGENPARDKVYAARPRCALGWYWHLLLPSETYFSLVSAHIREAGAVLEVHLGVRVLQASAKVAEITDTSQGELVRLTGVQGLETDK